MSIPQTIIEQLGGNKFVAMTGAKNFGTSGNNLSFKIGRNAGKVTHVKISYSDAIDLYDVDFLNIRGTDYKTIARREMVYAGQLANLFESVTKMRVSL